VNNLSLTGEEFSAISSLVYRKAGIYLPENKRYLVYNRLVNRLRKLEIPSFGKYLEYVASKNSELGVMINLITTNETFFFREPVHFEFLKELTSSDLAGKTGIRVWSAACSTGEEAYTIAMVLADGIAGGGWEVTGSDINETVLETAKRGIYPVSQKMKIPEQYLKSFCLKGVRSNSGKIAMADELRRHVSFLKINLNEEIPKIGMFDIVFLRNVLIYFDGDMKSRVLARVLSHVKRNGYLIVSHTESLIGTGTNLELVKKKSSIYKKV